MSTGRGRQPERGERSRERRREEVGNAQFTCTGDMIFSMPDGMMLVRLAQCNWGHRPRVLRYGKVMARFGSQACLCLVLFWGEGWLRHRRHRFVSRGRKNRTPWQNPYPGSAAFGLVLLRGICSYAKH